VLNFFDHKKYHSGNDFLFKVEINLIKRGAAAIDLLISVNNTPL